MAFSNSGQVKRNSRERTASSLHMARYKPLTSRTVSRNVTTRCSSESDMNDAQNPTIEESCQRNTKTNFPDSTEDRLTFQASKDLEAKLDVVLQYLKDNLVLEKMASFTQSLTRNPNLPYNPYPLYAQQFMPLSERFHIMKESTDAIKSKLQKPLQSTTDELIYGVQGHTNAWGLKSMLQVIDLDHVTKMQKITERYVPSNVETSELGHNYTSQILPSIVNPLILFDSVSPRPVFINIRLDYLIYGQDIDVALDIFTSSLISDVEQSMAETSECKLLYLSFTKCDSQGAEAVLRKWSRDKIRSEKEKLTEEIIQATKDINSVKAEVLFCRDDRDEKTLIRGSKEYVAHFIESTPELNGQERLYSFGRNPYQTLTEGIFLKKADAEAYVFSMSRHMLACSKGSPVKLTRKTSSKPHSEIMAPSTGSGAVKLHSDHLDEVIKRPLRQCYLRMLRRLSHIPDCFLILPIALALILMDRHKYKMESIISIYRLLQSTSYKFYNASQQNRVIVEFIQSFGLESNSASLLLTLVKQYKEDLLRTLDPSLYERPSHHVSYHSYFMYFFDEVESILKDKNGPFLETKQIVRKFSEFGLFCRTIQYQLTEDALKNLDKFDMKNFLLSCEEQLEPKDDVGKTSEEPQKSTKATMENEIEQKLILKHGAEPAGTMQQRLQYISIEEALESNNHPVIMAKEGILMQYLIDIRLDEVWGKYLKEIISSDNLPSNPYPRLITAMRRGANKMRLMGCQDELLRNQLLSRKQQLVDAKFNLFLLQESGVYGVKNALIGVDQDRLKKVVQLADVISDNGAVSQRGKFQISSGLSITGRTVFYGHTVPYVLKLEVHNHYYIKGPLGAGSEALQLFSRLVLNDIKKLRESSHEFVTVALVSDGEQETCLDDMDHVKISAVILDAASRKQSLYLKLYHAIGWRYVPIFKHYKLHFLFVDNADDRHEAYFPEKPAEDQSYLFMSREEAVEYLQKCSQLTKMCTKEKEMSLDKEVKVLIQNRKLLAAYETFLVQCLMNNSSHLLPDIWRVLHSPASQVEYIMSLAESLKELFAICLKYRLLEKPSAPPVTVGSTASLPTKDSSYQAQSTVSVMKRGNINLQTLYRMTLAFYEKVSETLSEPTVFAPSCIQEVIDIKMAKVLDFKSSGIILNEQTLIELEEIPHLLHPLLVATSSEADFITQSPLQSIY